MIEQNDKKLGKIEKLIIRIVNKNRVIKSVENLLKEKGMFLYGSEDITAVDMDGETKSIGDLHKELKRMQMELEEQLLNYKTVPYVGSDNAGFISKIAASILDDPDLLINRLQTEFDSSITDMVKRFKELSMFFLNEKPRRLVINRLREASECYVHGFFQGCAILCRSTLETAIWEKFEEKIGRNHRERKTLGPLLDYALKFGIISNEYKGIADKVKLVGDESGHDFKRCSASEALETLSNTKILLNTIYQK